MSNDQERDNFPTYGMVAPGTNPEQHNASEETDEDTSQQAFTAITTEKIAGIPVWENSDIPVSKGGHGPETVLGKVLKAFRITTLTSADQAAHDAFWKELADTRQMLEKRDEQARRLKQEQDFEQAHTARVTQQDSDRKEYILLLEDKIFRTNQQRRWNALAANVKGGAGKTPVSCNLASVNGHVTRRVTTVLDNNPNMGTAGLLLGISPQETISVRKMHEAINSGEITNFSAFSAPLGSNRFNVQLIASDEMAQRDSYGYELAKNVIEIMKQNTIFGVIDTGNEISNDAMQAALELTDVLIVVTLKTESKIQGAVSTMKNFREWGHGPLVRHAIVVVSGLLPGESAEDYRAKLNLDDKQILIGIPFDQRIHDDEVVNINLMPRPTYTAYLELALAVAMVAKYRDAHREEKDVEPLSIIQGQLVPLPSGRTPVLPYVSHSNVRQADVSAPHQGVATSWTD